MTTQPFVLEGSGVLTYVGQFVSDSLTLGCSGRVFGSGPAGFSMSLDRCVNEQSEFPTSSPTPLEPNVYHSLSLHSILFLACFSPVYLANI